MSSTLNQPKKYKANQISDAKIKLAPMVGAEPALIKLILYGKTPEDDKTLGELNVKEGDFMIMIIMKQVKKEEKKEEPKNTEVVLNPQSLQPLKPEFKPEESKKLSEEPKKLESGKEELKKEEQKKEEQKK